MAILITYFAPWVMVPILILGGSHRDVPLIKASQELGYFVISLGDRDYYLGHNYSDKYYRVNFNDLAKVKEIIRNEKIDYFITQLIMIKVYNYIKIEVLNFIKL